MGGGGLPLNVLSCYSEHMRCAAAMALGLSLAVTAAAQDSPRDLYHALNALRVDGHRVYFLREVELHRGVLSFHFSEGKLAFLEPLEGRVTGAVFTGAGRIIAIPRDPVERGSLAKFLGAPLLDQPFSRAYLRFTDQTAQELQERLGKAGAEPAEDPGFAADWNVAVAELAPGHSLRVMEDWLAVEPEPYFCVRIVGDLTGPFDVLVDARRDEPVLIGQTRWINDRLDYDVWASLPRDGPAPPRALAPLDYRVETTIEPNLALEGQTALHLKVVHGGDRVIPLELSRLLQVQSVTDDTGQPLVFFQNDEMSRHEIASRGNDSLLVVLPGPAVTGQELELRVAYRGNVISDAGNGVYFVGSRGSWYPHLGGTDLFARFDLNFRWPRRLELVATGQKLEEHEEGDSRVARWRSQEPIPVAGFNLGEYSRVAVEAGRTKIELFANQQLEREIANRLSAGLDPATILQVWPPGRLGRHESPAILEPPAVPSPAAVLKQLGENIAEAVRFDEKLLGPFPFDRLAVTQIPGSFGQGWPGLLYLSTLSFLPPEAAQRAGVRPGAEREFAEVVPFHELAHQWWGNLVGWSTYRDQWIDEALANYVALLYADAHRPNKHFLARWLEDARNRLTKKPPGSQETPDEAGPLILGYRLNSSKSPQAYDEVVYRKGAWVFHMLRMMMREPGSKDPDARFHQLLRSIVERYRYRALSTGDLERAVEKSMTPAMDLEGTQSMAWFFDEWVRGTGIPKYSASFRVKPHGAGFLIRGTLEQNGVPAAFLAAVPLYAVGATGKPVPLGTVIAAGPETRFEFTTRFRPRRIVIDPQRTLLCRTE